MLRPVIFFVCTGLEWWGLVGCSWWCERDLFPVSVVTSNLMFPLVHIRGVMFIWIESGGTCILVRLHFPRNWVVHILRLIGAAVTTGRKMSVLMRWPGGIVQVGEWSCFGFIPHWFRLFWVGYLSSADFFHVGSYTPLTWRIRSEFFAWVSGIVVSLGGLCNLMLLSGYWLYPGNRTCVTIHRCSLCEGVD